MHAVADADSVRRKTDEAGLNSAAAFPDAMLASTLWFPLLRDISVAAGERASEQSQAVGVSF